MKYKSSEWVARPCQSRIKTAQDKSIGAVGVCFLGEVFVSSCTVELVDRLFLSQGLVLHRVVLVSAFE